MQHKFLVDIDGVLAQTQQAFVDFLKQNLPGFNRTLEDWSQYWVEKAWPEVTEHYIERAFGSQEFYKDVPVFPFAVELCRTLSTIGEVHLVTARHFCPGIEEVTEDWLINNGLYEHCFDVVHEKDKAGYAKRVGITFAIEDSPQNAVDLSAVCPVFLHAMPYNTGHYPNNVARVSGLENILAAIELMIATQPKAKEKPDSILLEAHDMVHGDRGNDYGHPYYDFARIADMWTGYLRDTLTKPIEPEDVPFMMNAVKASRGRNDILRNRPVKRDNWADTGGYAETGFMVTEKRKEFA